MKNGYLKNNSNEINSYVSSKNVEHNGLSLHDTLDIMDKNIKQLIMQSSLSIVGSQTIDKTTTEGNQTLQLIPTNPYKNNDMFEIKEDGTILVTKLVNPANTPGILGLQCENGNPTLGDDIDNVVVLRIQVWRNGQNLTPRGVAEHTLHGKKRDTACVLLTQHLQQGDEIKLLFSAQREGTYNYRGNWFIIQSEMLLNNMIDYPSI